MGSTRDWKTADWEYGDAGDVPARWSRDKKIEALVPAAKRVAGRFVERMRSFGMTYDDLFGAAMFGVIEGVDDYLPGRGKLSTFAYLCAWREVCDAGEKYNPTSRHFRERAEYVRVCSLNTAGWTGETCDDVDTPEEWLLTLPDPCAGPEQQVLSGADAAEAWENWAAALTPLERHFLAGLIRAGDAQDQRFPSATKSRTSRYAELAAQAGVGIKVVDNATNLGRRRLRTLAAAQGLDPDTATRDELLALRVPAREKRGAKYGWLEAEA